MTISLLRAAGLSRINGVVHGFTTREGGQSKGAFCSLNLGLRIGDVSEVVRENRRAVRIALGRESAHWVSAQQVHGRTVVEVTRNAGPMIEADGLWSRDPDAVLAVLVADCAPVLLADVSGRAVAAVHAGWRGTADRIVPAMVQQLDQAGFGAADLRAAIGPTIGPCCFEIGEEVAERLTQAVPAAAEAISTNAAGCWTADLWSINRQLLLESGLAEQSIDVFRVCTACSAELFSHRRDQGETGRQAGVIGCAPREIPGR